MEITLPNLKNAKYSTTTGVELKAFFGERETVSLEEVICSLPLMSAVEVIDRCSDSEVVLKRQAFPLSAFISIVLVYKHKLPKEVKNKLLDDIRALNRDHKADVTIENDLIENMSAFGEKSYQALHSIYRYFVTPKGLRDDQIRHAVIDLYTASLEVEEGSLESRTPSGRLDFLTATEEIIRAFLVVYFTKMDTAEVLKIGG